MGRHSGPIDPTGIRLDSQAALGPRRARLEAERAKASAFAAPATAISPTEQLPVTKEAPRATEVPEQLNVPVRLQGALDEISIVADPKKHTKARTFTAALTVVAASLGTAVVATSSSADNISAAGNQGVSTVARLAQNEEATSFTLNVDGETRTVTTSALTVADALEDAGILVDNDDRVSALMAGPIIEGATITITRVNTEYVTDTQTDAFTSSEVEDANLAKGTKKVTTPGADGVVSNTYAVTYEDGKEVSRTLQISAVTSQRVDEVVSVGTKDPAAGMPVGQAVPAGEAQQIASDMMGAYGWDQNQFSCLVPLWSRESGWRTNAGNPSRAYGIPQSLPGSKMASAGADWMTNPATQIKWGLGYIAGRYSTPCGAWAHFQAKNWY